MHDEYLKQIKKIIYQYVDKTYKVFLFGSRVGDKFKYNADYDIGIIGKQKLDIHKYLRIKSRLEELPILIDFVDFNRVSNDFKDIATKDIIYI